MSDRSLPPVTELAMASLALIVAGGIYRHDFVAEAVINGLMRVQLDMDVPVI